MSDEENKETEQEPEQEKQLPYGEAMLRMGAKMNGTALRSPCYGCHNEGPQCMGCINAPRGGINFW